MILEASVQHVQILQVAASLATVATALSAMSEMSNDCSMAASLMSEQVEIAHKQLMQIVGLQSIIGEMYGRD